MYAIRSYYAPISEHIDIGVNALITFAQSTYLDGVLVSGSSNSVTKSGTISNLSVSYTKFSTGVNSGTLKNASTQYDSSRSEYEFRFTKLANNSTISVTEYDTINVTCDITVGDVTYSNVSFSFCNRNNFV